jgi:hypothetical protein
MHVLMNAPLRPAAAARPCDTAAVAAANWVRKLAPYSIIASCWGCVFHWLICRILPICQASNLHGIEKAEGQA